MYTNHEILNKCSYNRTPKQKSNLQSLRVAQLHRCLPHRNTGLAMAIALSSFEARPGPQVVPAQPAASLRDDASKAAGVPLFYAALQVCHDCGRVGGAWRAGWTCWLPLQCTGPPEPMTKKEPLGLLLNKPLPSYGGIKNHDSLAIAAGFLRLA